jgi:phosphohistidine phosphatase SixA
MRIHLVRHAHAGQRRSDLHDKYRPLTPEGQVRAEALVDLFADQPVDRLLVSPATRCGQTLGPLSAARGIEVEEREPLWEGSLITDALAALEDGGRTSGVDSIVACTHGDIIPGIIDLLGDRGVDVSGRGCELGSVWILDYDGDRCRQARYVSSRATSL